MNKPQNKLKLTLNRHFHTDNWAMSWPWLCLVVMLIVVFSASVKAEQVSVIVEQSPPYIEKERNDKGLMSAIITAAFERSKVKTKLEFSDWYKVEQYVDNKRYLSFMWVKTKPLMKKWLFSEPIYIQRNKFAFIGNKPQSVQYLHQLRGVKIGLTQGFSYGTPFDKFRSHLDVVESSSDYQNVQRLLNNKVAMIAIDPPVAKDLINKYFSQFPNKNLTFVDAPYFNQTVYYLVCAKNYGNCLNYIKKFNQGLVLINKDGTSKRILSAQSHSD